MSGLLNIDVAREQLLKAIHALSNTETVPLLDAYNRVTAENYVAQIDVPPAANSAMDGYAVNTSDCFVQTQFAISQRIPAGAAPQPLQVGTAARIFTGAEIPAGANAVVIQENCTQHGELVTLNTQPTPGDNIRPQGQDIVRGTVLFSPGHLLRAQDVALLASVNIAQVCVKAKLRVAIFSTGDELLEPGETLMPGKIYNSNRYLLTGFLRKNNCDILDLGIVKDTLDDSIAALQKAADADLIISSGGVSVGEEDHIKTAVTQLGDIQFWKLNLKPGKPLAFGRVLQTPFLGLPGNPVSAFVNLHLFAQPLIQKLQGLSPRETAFEIHPAQFSIAKPLKRCEFFRGRINENGVALYPQQSSGALSSTVWADCLVRVNDGESVNLGDPVRVYRLD